MKIPSKIILASIGLLSTTSRAASTCDSLNEQSSPQDLPSYLQEDRSTLKPSCIGLALRRLGSLEYLPAIPVLIQYLDFRKPQPKNMPSQPTNQPSNGYYPASAALGAIGKYAIPAVKKAIEDDSLNTVQLGVAIELYAVWLSHDSVGDISFLARASKASKKAENAALILDLATELARRCMPDVQDKCFAALNGK